MQTAGQPLCLPAYSTTKFYPVSCCSAQGHTGRVSHDKAPDPWCSPVTVTFVTMAPIPDVAAAPKWCQPDVTQESRHRARAVPQPPPRDSHTNPWGTQPWEQLGQGAGPGSPCQPDTTHPSEQGGQHIWTSGQQSIGINQSHSLWILWAWGRDSSATHSHARHSAPSCPPQAPRFSGISMETSCAKRYKARISFPSSFHSSRTFVPFIITYFTGTRQQGQSLTHRCAA